MEFMRWSVIIERRTLSLCLKKCQEFRNNILDKSNGFRYSPKRQALTGSFGRRGSIPDAVFFCSMYGTVKHTLYIYKLFNVI